MLLEKGQVDKANLKHIDYKVWLKDVSSFDDENCIRILASVIGKEDNKEFLNKIYAKDDDNKYKKVKVYIIGRFKKVNLFDGVLTYELVLDRSAYVMYDKYPALGELFL